MIGLAWWCILGHHSTVMSILGGNREGREIDGRDCPGHGGRIGGRVQAAGRVFARLSNVFNVAGGGRRGGQRFACGGWGRYSVRVGGHVGRRRRWLELAWGQTQSAWWWWRRRRKIKGSWSSSKWSRGIGTVAGRIGFAETGVERAKGSGDGGWLVVLSQDTNGG